MRQRSVTPFERSIKRVDKTRAGRDRDVNKEAIWEKKSLEISGESLGELSSVFTAVTDENAFHIRSLHQVSTEFQAKGDCCLPSIFGGYCTDNALSCHG
jgi:hypothetical protein